MWIAVSVCGQFVSTSHRSTEVPGQLVVPREHIIDSYVAGYTLQDAILVPGQSVYIIGDHGPYLAIILGETNRCFLRLQVLTRAPVSKCG